MNRESFSSSESFSPQQKLEARKLRLHGLHDEYMAIKPLEKEVQEILNKPEYQARRLEAMDFSENFLERTLTAEEWRKYQEYREKQRQLDGQLAKLLKDTLYLVSQEQNVVEWKQDPPLGVPGSFAVEHHRTYRAILNDLYALVISRYEYPAEGYFAHPSGKETIAYTIAFDEQRERQQSQSRRLFGPRRRRETQQAGLRFNSVEAEKDVESGAVLQTPTNPNSLTRFLTPEEKMNVATELIPLADGLHERLG